MNKTTSKDQNLGKINESLEDFLNWQQFKLGHQFKNQDLLIQSLTHTSFCHEQNVDDSNERLELLGDAVLQLIVTQKLFELFSHLKEGELSKLRGALVNEEVLSQLAQTLDIGSWLRLGRGELNEGGRQRPSLLADALESVLGAIYCEAGLAVANDCFHRWVKDFEVHTQQVYFDQKRLDYFDAKSRLQELTMQLYQNLPEYVCEEREGGFHCQVLINKKPVAQGHSHSKKQLMKELAQKILKDKSYLGK